MLLSAMLRLGHNIELRLAASSSYRYSQFGTMQARPP